MSSVVESTNYTRLCGLIVNTGCQVLRDLLERRLALLYNYCHKSRLGQCGADCMNSDISGQHQSFVEVLDQMRSRIVLVKGLKRQHRNLLFPDDETNPNIEVGDLDITLVCLLLQNICGLSLPNDDLWQGNSKGSSPEECIGRLRKKARTLVGTVFRQRVTTEIFDELWEAITVELIRLSTIYTQSYYDVLKTQPVDPVVHEQYIKDLCSWCQRGILPKVAFDWSKFVPVIRVLVSCLVALATYQWKFIKSAFVRSGYSLQFRGFELNEISIFFNIVVFLFGSVTVPSYTRLKTPFLRFLFVCISFILFRIVCIISAVLMFNCIWSLNRGNRYIVLSIALAVVILCVNNHYDIFELDIFT